MVKEYFDNEGNSAFGKSESDKVKNIKLQFNK
jgi:hypothetical protein